MGKRWSAGEAIALVQEFEASGLTRGEFSKRRGIAPTTLDYWRRRQRSQVKLVEVNVERQSAGAFTLSLRNGRRIESGWGFADEELVRLIRIVESA